MKQTKREIRHEGRDALRAVTENVRCHDCGRRSILPGGTVGIRKTAGGAVGFAGLYTCGAVWLCPVCNAKVMARRAIELGVVLLWAQEQGLHIIFGSLTCRHNKFTVLDSMLGMQTRAWRSVTSSGPWRRQSASVQVTHLKHDGRCPWVCKFDDIGHVHTHPHPTTEELPAGGCEWVCTRSYDTLQKRDDEGNLAKGRVGYIRAAEINIGPVNGWHPHFHPIILFRGDADEARWFADEVVEEWVVAIEDEGGEAALVGGQQLRVLEGMEVFDELTGYVTKQTYDYAAKGGKGAFVEPKKLGLEATWSQGKSTYRNAEESAAPGSVVKTLSHWSLLAAVAQGLADQAGQWIELEEATVGRRMITYSRGLRDWAGLNVENTDEEEAAREVGSIEDTVVVITARGWKTMLELPFLPPLVLDTLDEHGWPELKALLDFYAVEYATDSDLVDGWVSTEQGFQSSFADDQRAREYQEWSNTERAEK